MIVEVPIEQPSPSPNSATSATDAEGYSFQLENGVIEHAKTQAEAIARCPFLSGQPPDEAKFLLDISAKGEKLLTQNSVFELLNLNKNRELESEPTAEIEPIGKEIKANIVAKEKKPVDEAFFSRKGDFEEEIWDLPSTSEPEVIDSQGIKSDNVQPDDAVAENRQSDELHGYESGISIVESVAEVAENISENIAPPHEFTDLSIEITDDKHVGDEQQIPVEPFLPEEKALTAEYNDNTDIQIEADPIEALHQEPASGEAKISLESTNKSHEAEISIQQKDIVAQSNEPPVIHAIYAPPNNKTGQESNYSKAYIEYGLDDQRESKEYRRKTELENVTSKWVQPLKEATKKVKKHISEAVPQGEVIDEEDIELFEAGEADLAFDNENPGLSDHSDIEFSEELLEIKLFRDEQEIFQQYSSFLIFDLALLTMPDTTDEEIGKLFFGDTKEPMPVTMEIIKENISEKPLESTFLQLADFLASDPTLLDEMPIWSILDELRSAFDKQEVESPNNLNESNELVLTQEMVDLTILLFAILGHDSPEESVSDFIENYGEDTLINILDYLSHTQTEFLEEESLIQEEFDSFTSEGENPDMLPEFEKSEEISALGNVRKDTDSKSIENVFLEVTNILVDSRLSETENRQFNDVSGSLKTALSEAPRHVVTPEIINEAKELLKFLGYENPEKVIFEFEAEYGSDFLLTALEFIANLDRIKRKKLFESMKTSGGFDPTIKFKPNFEIAISDSYIEFVFLPAA